MIMDGVKKKGVHWDTQLMSELKITGDEADDFLLAFAKEFDVDISEFKIGDYFGDEEDLISAAIKDLFRNRKKKTLTIGQLEKAVIAGRLNESVINS